ncbi:MAG: hypothetical protein AB8H03_02220 [Saprospiraceae bacterium]
MIKNDFHNIEKQVGFKIPIEIKSFFKSYTYEDYGLILCDDETILEFETILLKLEIEEKLFPILDNENGDFAAIYLDGELEGMICFIEQGESDISPNYISIWSLFESIKKAIDISNEDGIDFYDLEKELPLLGNQFLKKDFSEIKNQLFMKFEFCTKPMIKRELAFKILKIVDEYDYKYVKEKFLRDDDMWIQERVINTLQTSFKQNYMKDIFEILDREKVNPLLAMAVILNQDKRFKNSLWMNEFKKRFPEIAASYIQ